MSEQPSFFARLVFGTYDFFMSLPGWLRIAAVVLLLHSCFDGPHSFRGM